jgi:hypothetical protein
MAKEPKKLDELFHDARCRSAALGRPTTAIASVVSPCESDGS